MGCVSRGVSLGLCWRPSYRNFIGWPIRVYARILKLQLFVREVARKFWSLITLDHVDRLESRDVGNYNTFITEEEDVEIERRGRRRTPSKKVEKTNRDLSDAGVWRADVHMYHMFPTFHCVAEHFVSESSRHICLANHSSQKVSSIEPLCAPITTGPAG